MVEKIFVKKLHLIHVYETLKLKNLKMLWFALGADIVCYFIFQDLRKNFTPYKDDVADTVESIIEEILY